MSMKTLRGLSLSLSLLALGTSCQSVKFEGPGSSGALPGGTLTGRQAWQEEGSAPPRTPLCDVPAFHGINVNQQNVDCNAPFNYVPLYDHALGLAKALASETKCPAGCQPAHHWIEQMSTTCLGTVAGVNMEIGILCPRPATPRPRGQTPAAATLIGPERNFPDPLPAPKPRAGTFRANLPAPFVGCSPIEYVLFDYRESVADCTAATFDFRVYVEYAQRRAPAVCGPAVCAPGCKDLSPPVLAQTTWACRPNGREVQVTIQVQCCKP